MRSHPRLRWAVPGMSLFLAWSSPLGAVSLEEVKHERASSVTELPEFARIGNTGDTILILRGHLSAKRAKAMASLARAIHRDVKLRFLSAADRSGRRPVDVCLFQATRAYRTFVTEVMGPDHDQSDLGFYVPYRRMVVANLERGLKTLRHEIVHPLLEDDTGTLPHWATEGLASLYDSVDRTKKGIRFRLDHRMADVRRALAAGTLPGPAELARSDDRDVYGPAHQTYYGLGRALLLYLDRQGKLARFVRALRSQERKPGWQTAVLKRHVDWPKFIRWLREVR